MRTPEDPTRDPASEARDDWEQLCQPLTDEERRENARKIESLSVPDRFALMFSHASEPRATPETDGAYLVIRGSNSIYVCDELGAMATFARRLERQRDELLAALEDIAFGAVIKRASGGCGQRQLSSAVQMSRHAESAIAAVKGGNG